MTKEKFSLFMGNLGNGITVCNGARNICGDYQRIAHITDFGKIKWYVPQNTVPADAVKIIEHTAEQSRQKYLKWWSGLSTYQKYERLLDALPIGEFLQVLTDKTEISKKVERAEQILYELA